MSNQRKTNNFQKKKERMSYFMRRITTRENTKIDFFGISAISHASIVDVNTLMKRSTNFVFRFFSLSPCLLGLYIIYIEKKRRKKIIHSFLSIRTSYKSFIIINFSPGENKNQKEKKTSVVTN